MSQFSFGEKYRLEVHWEKVIYEEGFVKLLGCKLTGPVVAELELINKDSIKLDFVSQYIALLPQYYIATLSWDGVERKNNIILLDNVLIENTNINNLPTFTNDDFIVIDTSDHEDEKHNYNVTYKSYVIKSDGIKYNFNKG